MIRRLFLKMLTVFRRRFHGKAEPIGDKYVDRTWPLAPLGSEQGRTIVDYAKSSKIATVDWTTAPDETATFNGPVQLLTVEKEVS